RGGRGDRQALVHPPRDRAGDPLEGDRLRGRARRLGFGFRFGPSVRVRPVGWGGCDSLLDRRWLGGCWRGCGLTRSPTVLEEVTPFDADGLRRVEVALVHLRDQPLEIGR